MDDKFSANVAQIYPANSGRKAQLVNLSLIQRTLREAQLDGWLLYDFRGSNPIALHLAGMESSGTRRWFLWIPGEGRPRLLLHAIEVRTFDGVDGAIDSTPLIYVGWRDLEEKLALLIGAQPGQTLKIAMEYSPHNAVPYVSTVDAGTKEMVEAATNAQIVTSADLVQIARAVLTSQQATSHRRAVTLCMAIKEAAFALIRDTLMAGRPLTEYDVQSFIMDRFREHDLDPDHPPIVAVNASAADPHYAPSSHRHNPIQRGDVVLIDLWARERNSPEDCFADISWMGYCGEAVPERVQAVFSVVAAARDRAPAFIQERLDAGQAVYGYEVDDACRQVIIDAGYADFVKHRSGHSLGSEVHFRGVNIDNIETQDQRRLIPGVLFTIEPGIYMSEFNFDDSPVAKGLGVRTEINCYMHADRVEVTTLPLQREVIALLRPADADESV